MSDLAWKIGDALVTWFLFWKIGVLIGVAVRLHYPPRNE